MVPISISRRLFVIQFQVNQIYGILCWPNAFLKTFICKWFFKQIWFPISYEGDIVFLWIVFACLILHWSQLALITFNRLDLQKSFRVCKHINILDIIMERISAKKFIPIFINSADSPIQFRL